MKDIFWKTIIVLMLFVLSHSLFVSLQTIYYTYAPYDRFYDAGSLVADDLCYGDTEHFVTSQRVVGGTDIGWHARISRELYSIESNSKVYDEFASPFIEVRDEVRPRTQRLPLLDEGQYYWSLHISLLLPLGVVRDDIPVLISNTFEVNKCI